MVSGAFDIDMMLTASPAAGITSPAVSLPEELADWARTHAASVSRVITQLLRKPLLHEQALWEIVAGEFSPEWEKARRSLLRAEAQVAEAMKPENMPLGLIGKALHSDEINHITRIHNIALTGFTVINETLRGEEPLVKFYGVLREHQSALQQSLELSRNIARMNAEFAAAATLDDTFVSPQGGVDKTTRRTRIAGTPRIGALTRSFTTLGTKLFGGKPAKRPANTKKPDMGA